MCGTFAPESDTPQCHIQQYTQCIHVLGVHFHENTLLNNATYFSLLYFELAVDTMLLCTLPKLDTLFGVSTQRPVCKYREKNCM